MGNVLDHFDISLYSFLAPLLAPLFFPNYEPIVQLILTYSVVAISFITEPLGVFIFGLMVERRGPAYGLSYSLIGVALSTVLMGFLPSFEMIGYGAPLGLLLLRTVRAICASGETTISRLYIMDGKSEKKALTASYWYNSSTMLGIIFASALSTVIIGLGSLYPETKPYAWRCCFILGGVTGFFGYYLRQYARGQEKLQARNDSPNKALSKNAPSLLPKNTSFHYNLFLLWHHRIKIIQITVVSSLSYVTYTIPFIFMNSFSPLVTSVSLETMMSVGTALLIFDTVIIPLVGRYTANHKPVKVLLISSFVLSISIIPLFAFLENSSFVYICFVRLWIVFWGVVFLCPLNYWYRQQFQGPEQYFLIGMGNAFGAATLGRYATPACLWLWHMGQTPFWPACYITLVALMAFGAIARTKHPLKEMKSLANSLQEAVN